MCIPCQEKEARQKAITEAYKLCIKYMAANGIHKMYIVEDTSAKNSFTYVLPTDPRIGVSLTYVETVIL